MENIAKKPGLSVVATGKRKTPPPGTPPKEARKKVPPPALALVPAAKRRSGLRAPVFVQLELDGLRALVEGMRSCDVINDLEFRFFVERASRSESTGLEIRTAATRLNLAPMTLQRWSRGAHLPFPLPRRGYLDGLIELVEDRITALEADGVDALLATPRRGSRRHDETRQMTKAESSNPPGSR